MACPARTVKEIAFEYLIVYILLIFVMHYRTEDAKSSLYILRPQGFDVNAEVSLMIAEATKHSDKDEVSIFFQLSKYNYLETQIRTFF